MVLRKEQECEGRQRNRLVRRNCPEDKVGEPRQQVGRVLQASGTNIPFSASGRPKHNDCQCDRFEFHVFLLDMGG